MSIYPVRLSSWFPVNDENHGSMRLMVKWHKCVTCNKSKMNWRYAYGHHSIPWGHGDIWCSKRCFNKKRVK
jgi:hypothetical protein